jgi:hypothetical protein
MKIKTIANKIEKTLVGGTKSDERRRKQLSSAIEGTANEHRIGVNKAIQKLTKLVGNEFVGPPEFQTRQKWIDKFNVIKQNMHRIGEIKNDKALVKGGWTDNNLDMIKKEHEKLLKEQEKKSKLASRGRASSRGSRGVGSRGSRGVGSRGRSMGTLGRGRGRGGATPRRPRSAPTPKKSKKKSSRARSHGKGLMLNIGSKDAKPRLGEGRKKYLTRLKRGRTSRNFRNNRTNRAPNVYNENMPVRRAKKRLSMAKSYGGPYKKTPMNFNELPDDILDEISRKIREI